MGNIRESRQRVLKNSKMRMGRRNIESYLKTKDSNGNWRGRLMTNWLYQSLKRRRGSKLKRKLWEVKVERISLKHKILIKTR